MRRVVAYPALVTLGTLVLGCLGLNFPFLILFFLAFGWCFFLARVMPGVTVDWSGVAIAGACLALFGALAHSFFGWLHRQMGGTNGPVWRPRWTASLVSGVVLMFAAGISAAGIAHQLGWLLTMKEPWFDSLSWARRAQSVNNLKQIGLALANYETDQRTLPPATTIDAEGRLLHGWQARLLPFMEQADLYNRINFAAPWDDPRNEAAFRTQVQAYLNPGVRTAPQAPGPAPSHYSANAQVLSGDSARKSSGIPDGTSNTILAGEAAGEFKPWGYPANSRDPARGINRTPDGFGGPYPGGANFLFADGSVHFLKDRIDPKIFRALGTPDGSEAISAHDY
jgi:prepilin-type processing-associated H-X9-DG protein